MASRGQFVWEELTTTDTTSAGGFYGKVAGLKTEAAPGGSSYTLLVASAGRIGGLLALGGDTGASPHWLSYISTLNVDETGRQAESLGGRVVKPPAQMGDGGRFAVLKDPQGAVFAVYTPPRPSDRSPAVSLGSMSWHELATNDFVGAFSFYQSLFGWHVVNDMDMGPGMGIYRLFAAEGSKDQLGGMYTKPANQPGPPAWLPYIRVASVASATAAAKKLGAVIIHGPADVPGGKITMGTDPQGAMFAVHEVTGTMTAAERASNPGAKAGAKKKSAVKKKKAAPKRKAKAAKKKAAKKKKAAPKKRKAGSKK